MLLALWSVTMDLSFENYDSILTELKGKGLDLHLRSETLLKRKLENFFDQKKISSVDLFSQNTSSSGFISELQHYLIVDKTEVFRYADAWNFLRSFIEMKGGAHHFSIYIPQCASGEDLISFAIIFDRLGFSNYSISADAENEQKLLRAKALYFEDFKHDVSHQNFGIVFDKSLFENYFSLREKKYFFNKNVDKHIVWSTDTLERKTNIQQHEIVYAANILNQYKSEGQRNLLANLYAATKLNGYLILGNQEPMPLGFYANMFKKVDDKLPIYQKTK